MKKIIHKSIEISVVLPAYRQEKNIIANLQKVENVIKEISPHYEIICVVDGVVDKTFQNAKKVVSSRLKVVGYERNRGKGAALRFGLGKAKGKKIMIVDSGNDINYSVIRMMLEHFSWYNADIVVGSKRHPVSKVVYPLKRRILSVGYQTLTRLLFGLKVRDTQVGMKVFRTDVIKKLLPRLLVKQYAFDIEILAVANYLGFNKIYEAPVDIRLDFNKSSGIISKGFIRTVSQMIWDTVAVFYRLKIRHYYDDKNMIKWHTDVFPDEI